MAKIERIVLNKRSFFEGTQHRHSVTWQTELLSPTVSQTPICSIKSGPERTVNPKRESHWASWKKNSRLSSKIAMPLWKNKEVLSLHGRKEKPPSNIAAIARQNKHNLESAVIYHFILSLKIIIKPNYEN